MEASPTYRIMFSGAFKPEIDPDSAIAAFAAMARIPKEKAAQVLTGERVLKKDLDLKVAHTYREKLEAIGLQVALQAQAPARAPLELSLEPIQDRYAEAPVAEPEPVANSLSSGQMQCPKCGLEQYKAPQCAGCGVYVHKVQSRPEATVPAVRSGARVVEAETSEFDEPADPKPLSVAVAALAAVICAYLWLGIAVVTEYESGIAAWAIGGVVGFAAIATGSAGIRTGVMCGALALASILGGKYLVVDHFYGELASTLREEMPEEGLFAAYQTYNEMARYYAEEVDSDAELRRFMVQYEFTEKQDPDLISKDELAQFRAEEGPLLKATAKDPVDTEAFRELDQLTGTEYAEGLLGYDTWDALKQDLGPVDFVFFLLGIATAFRFGMTGRFS